MDWIVHNLPSVCILAAVVAFVALLVYSLVKSKRNGKSSCSGCSGCAMAGKCSGYCGTQPTGKNN